MIVLGTSSSATRNITSNFSLITGTLSAACADAVLEIFFGSTAAPVGNLTVFVQDASGYTYGFATDTFTRTANTYAIVRLALPSGNYTVRIDSDNGSDTAVEMSAVLRDVTPTAALTTQGYTPTVAGRIDAAVSSRLATAGYTAPLDAAGTRTAIGLTSAVLTNTVVGRIDAAISSVTAGSGLDAAGVRAAIGLTTAALTDAVVGRIDANISSVSGGGGWSGIYPPREMSGDRIGFSHPDSATFYYLVNNAADATPTTFTGTASGSTRSVLRTTVADDVADGFTVLTVYKQVGGSVVHANDTPVGAILINKTAGVVTERLLTQTELDAIRTANLGGGGPYVDDPVAVGRLARLTRNTTGLVANGANGITIKVGDVDVLCGADFARDLPTNARVTSITSLTPSAAGFTATAIGVDHTQAKFTLSASTAGTYTLAVKVAYSQGGGTVTGTVAVRVIA